MPFTIIRQDITKMKVDAIVNAANASLQMGGGVCGAIFNAAGAERLQTACNKLAPIQPGEAVITPGYGLPAKFVIHAVGPVYRQEDKEESRRLLYAAYTNALKRAVENQYNSIAFPLISSGIYGYPKEEALQVATAAIRDFLADHDLDITLAVFDKASFAVSRKLMGEVASYIDEHFVDLHTAKQRQLRHQDFEPRLEAEVPLRKPSIVGRRLLPHRAAETPASLDELVGSLDESFSRMLLRLIDAQEMTDVEVYKRANMDRKLFSKIRSDKGYMPSKRTALALAIALRLSPDETDDLLARAGYALSSAVMFDVIVSYFIAAGKYDVFEINEVLFAYDQPLL